VTAVEFDALIDTLPNGLHDSDLVSLALDLAAAEVQCIIDVDLSDPHDPASEGRSRRARLGFTGVSCVSIDPPGLDLSTRLNGWMDAGSGAPSTSPRADLEAPEGGFLAWIYLNSANSFIRVGARQASIAWPGETRDPT
jgi:hypothetical protein